MLLHIVTASLASQVLTVNMKRTCSYWKAQWCSFCVMLLRLHLKPTMQLIRDDLSRLIHHILQGLRQYAFTANYTYEKGQFCSLPCSGRRQHAMHNVNNSSWMYLDCGSLSGVDAVALWEADMSASFSADACRPSSC